MTIKWLPYVSVLPGVCVISLVPSLVSIILDSNKRHTVLFLCFVMKSGDNKQCSKPKVQRKNTQQEQSKHDPQQKLKVESGVMKE